MPLWVSDFLGDTLDLDASEVGAYMLLLMAQWQRAGESLPNDEKKLQRIARCGRSWPKIWGNVSRFFTEDEQGVYSKRLRLESQNVASKRLANAKNGALGGRPKALEINDRTKANGLAKQKRHESIPEPEPYKRDKSLLRAERFGDFWNAYPHRNGNKVDRKKCEVAYAKAVKSGVVEETIVAAATAYATLKDVRGGYGKACLTWLNGAGWQDEVQAQKPNGHIYGAPDDYPKDEKGRVVIGTRRVLSSGQRQAYLDHYEGWMDER